MLTSDTDILKQGTYKKFLGLRVAAWVEIICFYSFLSLGAFLFGAKINYFAVSPHPYWILIVLMSAQYGTNEGLTAALIGTVILELGPLPVRNILQDKSEYFFLLAKTPLMWFVTAVILGELRMKHMQERDLLRAAALEANEKQEKIATSYNSLKKLKERLEMRVASEMQTTLMVINAFKELEEQGREGIINGANELTKTLVAPEKFSIFLLEKDSLICACKDGWQPSDHFEESFGPDTPIYQEIVENHRILSLHISDPSILQDQGVLAAPIICNPEKQVFGMIKVEQIPVVRLNTATIETLRLIGEWVGKSYSNYHIHQAKE